MKRTGKGLAVTFLAFLFVVISNVGVSAAPSRTYTVANSALHNRSVDSLRLELEQTYAVTIEYPYYERYGAEVAAIYPQSLRTLETAFTALTPQLTRQVAAYFQEEYGRTLTVAYVFADLRGPYGTTGKNDVVVGTFDSANARIELYIPRPGEGAIATGDNVFTVTHEFGHAVHQLITDKYGYEKMESEWLEMQEQIAFGKGQQDKRTFITEYASTSFDEDFAETFAYVFACNRPGLGFSNLLTKEYSQDSSILGRKVAYIENLLPQHLTGINRAMLNYRKIYSTPTSVNYKGIKLSGFHLVSIGLEEPRSVPLMLVTLLRIDESGMVWISEIGAWYTTDLFGNHLCLFPDGTWGNAGRNMLAA